MERPTVWNSSKYMIQILHCLFLCAAFGSTLFQFGVSASAITNRNAEGNIIHEGTDAEVTREARIILPKQDNNGTQLDGIKIQLELKVLERFGGFTETQGEGGWNSNSRSGSSNFEIHHEPVWIYDIGCIDNSQSQEDLTTIALWVKQAANQLSVYLRLPNGQVQYV